MSSSSNSNRSGRSTSAFTSAGGGRIDANMAASSHRPASSRSATSPGIHPSLLSQGQSSGGHPAPRSPLGDPSRASVAPARPERSYAEADSLRHLANYLDGKVSGPDSVTLSGISGDHFSRVIADYQQTGDRFTMYQALPPGSVMLELSAKQIETASNAYHETRSRNAENRSLNTNNHPENENFPPNWSLANYQQDPVDAAYQSIGAAATLPRSAFEQYISEDGLTDHGAREHHRLSEPRQG